MNINIDTFLSEKLIEQRKNPEMVSIIRELVIDRQNFMRQSELRYAELIEIEIKKFDKINADLQQRLDASLKYGMQIENVTQPISEEL